MSQIRQAEKKGTRAAWPLLGFILAVCLGTIGYFLSPQLIALAQSRGVNTSGVPPLTAQLIFAGLFFVAGLTVFSLIIAIFAPKKSDVIKRTDLAKERKDILDHQREIRLRQRSVAREFKNKQDNKK
jgi:hypothetical protein